MGFFSDLVDVGKSIFGGIASFKKEHPILSSVISTAVTGLALNKVQKSVEKTSHSAAASKPAVVATDYGVQLQIPANQDNKVPIVYGRAFVPGMITEAVMSNSRQTMTYVITICEQTGGGIDNPTGKSTFTFKKIYWDNKTVNFESDGFTVASLTDDAGNVDTNPKGLIKMWFYAGGSTYSVSPTGVSAPATVAYDKVPNWTTAHTMNDLVFVVVEVTYNKTKNVTGVPNLLFDIQNSLTQPGDCIYDLMTNTRYGAGIAVEDIYV